MYILNYILAAHVEGFCPVSGVRPAGPAAWRGRGRGSSDFGAALGVFFRREGRIRVLISGTPKMMCSFPNFGHQKIIEAGGGEGGGSPYEALMKPLTRPYLGLIWAPPKNGYKVGSRVGYFQFRVSGFNTTFKQANHFVQNLKVDCGEFS